MDINKKKHKTNKTRGSVTLEASIGLTLFLFLMLFLYSFLVVFEARNQLAHTTLTTANSLAFDSFSTGSVNQGTAQDLMYKLYDKMADSSGKYVDHTRWYENEDSVKKVVKQRFLHYLSGGNEDEADRILKELNIEGGFDGLDFSNCKVVGDDIYIEIQYTLNYEFQVFGMGSMKFSQSCCSKLW